MHHYDVINDKNVDVVYISTPVGNHEEWVLKSAKKGKHVLCEKSSTISFESAKKWLKWLKKIMLEIECYLNLQ